MSTPAQNINPIVAKSPAQRGSALIVDDDITNRLVLRKFLSKEGFEIIEAENGRQAIDCYLEQQPDIIFMDLMMPVMDGLESSRQIKSISSEFVPIIFLTAMTDSDTITRCTEAGGDDFLSKPVDKIQLQAKIHSMERIRDMHRDISLLHKKIFHEQQVAEHIFTHVIGKNNAHIEHIYTLLRPADLFSGDMLLTAFTPSRDIHILLADFTGHGLSAALGALPVSETFHTMTAKGFSIEEIIGNINRKLHQLLPTNMFMAMQYISISHNLEYVKACNCGMPDILLLNEECSTIKARWSSRGMPLGIDTSIDFSKIIEHRNIANNDRIILASDGVHEATNVHGEQFGQDRFEQALLNRQGKDSSASNFNSLINTFDAFCHGSSQTDDISLVEIPCIPENLPPWDMHAILQFYDEKLDGLISAAPVEDLENNTSEINLLFNAQNLKQIDPVPLAINYINQLTTIDIPQQSLFMILTELYVNALDHGVLGLDSTLKSNADGFEQYFNEREQRLNTLNEGHIHITVRMQFHETGGQINLLFEDSGLGFDYENYEAGKADESALSGRGISLIKQLCTSVTYSEPGNKVEAIYQWNIQDS